MMSSEDEFFEVEKIIDSKIDEASGKYRYRIRWKGFGPEHDTWEPKENLSLCLDLLKAFKEEKKRKKLLKKKMSVPPINIKSEPLSENEQDGIVGEEEEEEEEEEDGQSDKNGDEEQTKKQSNDNPLLDGLTRQQKKQYLDVLERSKTDKISPTEINAPLLSPSQDSLSESSEIITKKKKKNKKKMVFTTDSENEDDINFQSAKKKMPSEILDSVLHPNKKTIGEEKKQENATNLPIVKPVPPQKLSVAESKSKKILKSLSYVPLVDQLQEKTEIMNTLNSPVEQRKNLKKVSGNIRYEEKQNLPSLTGQQPISPKVSSVLDRPPNKRFDDIKSKIQNLQNLTHKRILVTGNLSKTTPLSSSSSSQLSASSKVSVTSPISPNSARSSSISTSSSSSKFFTSSNSGAAPVSLSTVRSPSSSISTSSNALSSPVRKHFVNKHQTNNSTITKVPPNKDTVNKSYKVSKDNTSNKPTENKNSLSKLQDITSKNLASESPSKNLPNKNLVNKPASSKVPINKDNTNKPVSSNEPINKTPNKQPTNNNRTKSDKNKTQINATDTISHSSLILDVLGDLELSRSGSSNKVPTIDVNYAESDKLLIVRSPTSSSSVSLLTSKTITGPQITSTVTNTIATSSIKTTVSSVSKKILKRTVSEPSHSTANENITNNKKEKSKKISVKEYQTKKQRRDSIEDSFPNIEFTRLPSSSSIAKAVGPIRTSNFLDNSTIILPKPIENRTRSLTQTNNQVTSPSNRVPREQLATDEDVLGNILQSFNPFNSRQTVGQQKTLNDKRIDPSEGDVPPSSSCESEDIILEEGDQNTEDQSSDFDTDLEECSSDEEFFEEKIPRPSHLQKPGTNSIQMEHIFVNQCICKGDIETLIKCQIREDMINEYVDGEDTLLMKAVMECAPPMVQVMLEKGANPNERSRNGRTPLMVAVELGQKKLVNMLIQHGAHLNLQTSDGKSALDIACNSGRIEIVHLLLLHGVDVKPTMESLNKATSRSFQVPQHLMPVLTSALNIHFEKLSEIVLKTLDVIKTNFTQLGQCLMPVRCLSPKEGCHTLYFDALRVNVTEKLQNMIFVAVPVIFERQGRIRVVYDIQNGVKDVILNPGPKEEKNFNIEAIEGSNFIHILFPTPGYNSLSIITDENSAYKILVSVYTVSFGRQTVVSHHRTQADTSIANSVMA